MFEQCVEKSLMNADSCLVLKHPVLHVSVIKFHISQN